MATATTREKRRIFLLISPVSVWLIFFFILPVCILFIYSFWTYVPGEDIQRDFTISNYIKLCDLYYLKILLETLWMGIKVTFFSLLLGFPIALLIAKANPAVRSILYVLVLAPLLTSAIVRTFGWMILLGTNGFVNKCFIAMGLIEGPLAFMYTRTAVVIALIEVLMPFMIFSLESILHNIDRSLYEAARNLGSNAIRVFFTITLPLSIPGIAAGSILVFSLAITALVSPALMGGPSNPVMPTLIYDQALNLINWPLGSATSFTLLFIVLGILSVYIKVLRLGKLGDILR